MTDEHILVARARRGDDEAFADLYRAHAPRILAYCRAHTPAPEDAEDAAQTTFCNAWAAIHRYQDRGVPFIAWLTRIAHNAITDLHRRTRPTATRDTRFLSEQLDRDGALEDGAPRPDETVERRDEHARLSSQLFAAIATLNPQRRDVILARFGRAQTTAQLARDLRISDANVRVIQHRALRQLRKELAPR